MFKLNKYLKHWHFIGLRSLNQKDFILNIYKFMTKIEQSGLYVRTSDDVGVAGLLEDQDGRHFLVVVRVDVLVDRASGQLHLHIHVHFFN